MLLNRFSVNVILSSIVLLFTWIIIDYTSDLYKKDSNLSNILTSDSMLSTNSINRIKIKIIEDLESVKRYQVIIDDQAASYRSVLELMRSGNEVFVNEMKYILSNNYNAIFWECHPVSFQSIDSTVFEFIISHSPELARVSVDDSTFADKFQEAYEVCSSSNSVTTFSNLGGDSQLVVPCPSPDSTPDKQSMAHIANFMRGGSHQHILKLWQKVGDTMSDVLGRYPSQTRWLSTSGLGVYWLHIRIDTRPKYYTFEPYRTITG